MAFALVALLMTVAEHNGVLGRRELWLDTVFSQVQMAENLCDSKLPEFFTSFQQQKSSEELFYIIARNLGRPTEQGQEYQRDAQAVPEDASHASITCSMGQELAKGCVSECRKIRVFLDKNREWISGFADDQRELLGEALGIKLEMLLQSQRLKLGLNHLGKLDHLGSQHGQVTEETAEMAVLASAVSCGELAGLAGDIGRLSCSIFALFTKILESFPEEGDGRFNAYEWLRVVLTSDMALACEYDMDRVSHLACGLPPAQRLSLFRAYAQLRIVVFGRALELRLEFSSITGRTSRDRTCTAVLPSCYQVSEQSMNDLPAFSETVISPQDMIVRYQGIKQGPLLEDLEQVLDDTTPPLFSMTQLARRAHMHVAHRRDHSSGAGSDDHLVSLRRTMLAMAGQLDTLLEAMRARGKFATILLLANSIDYLARFTFHRRCFWQSSALMGRSEADHGATVDAVKPMLFEVTIGELLTSWNRGGKR